MAYLPNIPKSLLQKPNLNRLASSMNQIVLLKKKKKSKLKNGSSRLS